MSDGSYTGCQNISGAVYVPGKMQWGSPRSEGGGVPSVKSSPTAIF
jgi:hypothetical protein